MEKQIMANHGKKHGIKRDPVQVVVLSSTQLTPNMQRLVLQGEGLSSFPVDCASSYIKLLFMADGRPVTDKNVLEQLNGQRPTMRTYTVRAFDAERLEMVVDFVRHGTVDGHLVCGALGDELPTR